MSPKLKTEQKEQEQVEKVTKTKAKAAEVEVEEEEQEQGPSDPTFGLDNGGHVLLTCRANELSDIIRRLCVPAGKEALVNPLPLRIKDKRISTEANSRFKGLAVFGSFPIDHQGDGEVCVDPIELRSFLDLYGDQPVAIQFSAQGRITVQGERRSSVFYALADTPPFYSRSFTEEEDGHATFKNGKQTQWVGSLKAKELAEAASPSNLLGVKTWTLIGSEDGLEVTIGSVEAKGRTVRTLVPVQFGDAEIEACGSEFGEDFGTLMNVISGDIELATGGDAPKGKVKFPAIIRNGPVTYAVMPRKNQTE